MRKISSAISISNAIDQEIGVTGYEIVRQVALVADELVSINNNYQNLSDWATLTTANTVITNADVVITNADVVSTNASAAAALASEQESAALEATSLGHRNAAAASETAAASSETNSNLFRIEAKDWANYPEDSFVLQGDGITEYSAKHWAIKAQAIAVGSLVYQGSYDASVGTYPLNPQLGFYYKISIPGSLPGGDVGVNDSIIYNGTGWDHLDNSDAVASVAGKTGAVTLVKGDVGLGNVDNTSDADKPISTAQATVNTAIASGTTKAGDAAKLNGVVDAVTPTINTIVKRNASGNVSAVPTAVLQILNSAGTVLKTINGISSS